MNQSENERRSLYIVGWVFLIIAVAAYLLIRFAHIPLGSLLLPCLVHELTGFYCPGCGGSRAVSLLLKGDFLKSLYYHPIVLYGMILYSWFMISNTIERLSKGRFHIGMHYKDRYVHIAVVILVLNFIIKNAVLLIWHYPMIP